MKNPPSSDFVSLGASTPGFSTLTITKPLLELGQKILADLRHNSHYTADPIFEVQRERKITGIDPDYTDSFMWIEDGEEVSDEEAKELEAKYEETGEVASGYSRVGYVTEMETLSGMYFFTHEAAQAVVDARPSDKLSVNVNSAYRNHEFKAIREYLATVAMLAEDHRPAPTFSRKVPLRMPVRFDLELGCLYDATAMHMHLVSCAEAVVVPEDFAADLSLEALPDLPQPAKLWTPKTDGAEPMPLFTEEQIRGYGVQHAAQVRLMFERQESNRSSEASSPSPGR